MYIKTIWTIFQAQNGLYTLNAFWFINKNNLNFTVHFSIFKDQTPNNGVKDILMPKPSYIHNFTIKGNWFNTFFHSKSVFANMWTFGWRIHVLFKEDPVQDFFYNSSINFFIFLLRKIQNSIFPRFSKCWYPDLPKSNHFK